MAIGSDVYQRVTDQIVAAIEAGAGKWEMPWHVKACDGDSMPHNVTSKRHYRGVNTIALWSIGRVRGFGSSEWGTYKQWAEKGAQVRKGERSALVVFWKFDHVTSGNDGDSDGDGGTVHRRVLARGYNVFNADQVDGYAAVPRAPIVEPERDAAAEAWFSKLGGDVSHGGSRAFYVPSQDRIQMPPFAAFVAPVHYYSTLAHEFTHWTGHASRCDRSLRGRFGDDAYAAEELIAELGAAFVCATLRLDSEPRPDHAQYLQSWLRVLKGDKRAIFTASAKAQQAVDWMAAKAGAAPVVGDDLDMAA
jgi:antirestriction protein ArdC